MALGGGVWVTQNKKLPGSYINFVSVKGASGTLSERGVVALPLALNWGADGVTTLTADDFYNRSDKILGYKYTADEMKGLREVFKNATKVLIYNLNTGGVKASNNYATAKYAGVRGNDLKIAITKTTDSQFKVQTLLDNKEVDVQVVTTVTDLASNDYVDFKVETLTETSGVALSGGTNGTTTGDEWTTALSTLETYTFNVLGAVTTDETVKETVVNWTKRMRDEMGVKFQSVVFNKAGDYEGIINVVNKVGETADIVYWVAGAQAGCAVNKSCTNKTYDGEYAIDVNYSQDELIDAINKGQFVFHRVGDEIRVLTDVNSLVTITEDKGEVFKSNQTIRVIDQIGNDIAAIFNNRFIGKIPNDNAGRISLQNAIVSHHKELQDIRAITDFTAEDVTVAEGNDKKSVLVTDNITVVNAMEKLYMTVVVS
jgi:hypothetical protein